MLYPNNHFGWIEFFNCWDVVHHWASWVTLKWVSDKIRDSPDFYPSGFEWNCQLDCTKKRTVRSNTRLVTTLSIKSKGSPYSITERRLLDWSRFMAVSLQVMWVINPAVGCHCFPPGLQLPPQPCQFLCLVNRGTMGVNSLPKTVTRQRHDWDLNPGSSAP